MCSSMAGVISSIVTIPIDNIRTRLNLQKLIKFNYENEQKVKEFINEKVVKNLSKNLNNKNTHICNKCIQHSNLKYPNIRCSMKIIFKEEGMRGFFKGASMRMV